MGSLCRGMYPGMLIWDAQPIPPYYMKAEGDSKFFPVLVFISSHLFSTQNSRTICSLLFQQRESCHPCWSTQPTPAPGYSWEMEQGYSLHISLILASSLYCCKGDYRLSCLSHCPFLPDTGSLLWAFLKLCNLGLKIKGCSVVKNVFCSCTEPQFNS